MNIIELIGFLIAFIAMFMLLFRKAKEDRRRREHPEEYRKEIEEQEKAIREFMKSIGQEVEFEEGEEAFIEEEPVAAPAPPPPPRKPETSHRRVRENYKLETAIEDYRKKTAIEKRKFQPEITESLFEDLGADIVSEELTSESLQRAYEIREEGKALRTNKVLNELRSPRDMVIIHEIFGKPKGIRPGAPWQEWGWPQ